MQLRALALVLLIAAGLLSGCGFQLRGATSLAPELNPIYLDSEELEARQLSQLQQSLQRSGAELTTDQESVRRLWVRISEPSSQKVAGSGLSDVELRRVAMSLSFRLSDADGQLLLQDEITRVRQLELDTNNVLAHERQLEQLSRQLQRELIRVMLFQMTHFR
ncbi:MAG: hypothetical protein QNJ69_12265 [Gammaproteobacteria bacterium]|nr:hypothetical protein [Gammaproteobacteria bacterium]